MAKAKRGRRGEAYNVILHPSVTEKTMAILDHSNALEFYVRVDASKADIANAVRAIFQVDVKSVNTRITKHGKRAIVYFPEGVSAEEIGMRIGVF